MSGAEETAPTLAVRRFAERHGINRRRATLAAALLGAVLLVSLLVMNQRIQARRTMAAVSADSLAFAPAVEPVEAASQRAAWADPREARRLAGDTFPAVPLPEDPYGGGEYVPLGRQAGARGHTGAPPAGDRAGGVPGFDPAAGDHGDPAWMAAGAYGTDERPPTPEEMRRAAFQRAVSSRQLRAGRGDGKGRGAHEDGSVPAPATPPGEGATGVEAEGLRELRPYGPEQVEEDRRAAERAAAELDWPRPQAMHGRGAPRAGAMTLVSSASRPCHDGERVLPAGYVITATLASRIDSEVPGPILARIGRDVYDTALRCVIFPAGSLLVGRSPDGLAVGGERLVVVWEQVVLGDGRTWTLPSLPAADRQGGIGIAGRVDRRTRQTLEAAALLSAFGAAIAYAAPGGTAGQPPLPGGYPSAPSARDRAADAATEPFRGAAGRFLDRAAGIRPVLRLDVGQPITVIVPRTLDLDRPAAAAGDTASSAASATPS